MPRFIFLKSSYEKQISLLMITNEDKESWYYLAVKKALVLLREITSKHHGDSYCLNYLHSFAIKKQT